MVARERGYRYQWSKDDTVRVLDVDAFNDIIKELAEFLGLGSIGAYLEWLERSTPHDVKEALRAKQS